jgi:hypothetical protein
LIAFCGDCPYRRGPVEIAAITLPTIWASVIGMKARESIRGHFSGTLAISKTRALGRKEPVRSDKSRSVYDFLLHLLASRLVVDI